MQLLFFFLFGCLFLLFKWRYPPYGAGSVDAASEARDLHSGGLGKAHQGGGQGPGDQGPGDQGRGGGGGGVRGGGGGVLILHGCVGFLLVEPPVPPTKTKGGAPFS